ncbi:hypothetical protein LguiA_007266 [Lonicera macranthoides]
MVGSKIAGNCSIPERGLYMGAYNIIGDNVILPGRVILEWFRNHTFMGDSVLLKLPRTSRGSLIPPLWYTFFVILEVIKEVKSRNLSVKSRNLSEVAEIRHHQYLSSLGLRYDSCNTGVEVELTFTKPGDDPSRHPIQRKTIFLRNTANITCLEHTIMGQVRYDDCSSYFACRKSCQHKQGKIEVGIRSLSPDIGVVKKWGIRLEYALEYPSGQILDYCNQDHLLEPQTNYLD